MLQRGKETSVKVMTTPSKEYCLFDFHYFSLHRLEHIDEVVRAARLSGYLDMRMVLKSQQLSSS